jgi:N4-gp56 family major capsid protein
MTTTQFSTNDVQTVKLWADRTYYDTISDETLVGQMIKDGSLILAKDLQASAGDNVKYHFLRRLSNAGLIGEQAATGNEQALTYDQDTVTIDQLRQIVQIPNKGLTISAQRVKFNLPEDTYQVLKNWMIERMTVGALNQLGGFTSTSFSYDGVSYTSSNYKQLTGMNAATAPSGTGRIFRPNSLTTDQAVNADTTATLKFSMIDKAVESARINRPYIKEFDGAIKYKCYVHYQQFMQLIQDTSGPVQYREIMLSKLASGVKDADLIGETMQYNNTLIIATDKVPNGVHSSTSAAQTNVRRAIFVGKEAGCIAFGQGFSANGNTTPGFTYGQDEVDVQQYKRISIVSIWGLEKTVYNSIDHGSIVLSTYVPTLS